VKVAILDPDTLVVPGQDMLVLQANPDLGDQKNQVIHDQDVPSHELAESQIQKA
jgi:hypothetical protein